MEQPAIHDSCPELFEVVFEQNVMGMGVRAIDPRDMRWLRVNRKFCDMLGYTSGELLRLSSLDLCIDEEKHVTADYNARLVSGDLHSYSREKRYLRKDGSTFWANVWLSSVCDANGTPVRVIVVVHDISEQKQAQGERMESEARLRAIFDNSPVCLNLKDTEGRYLYANRRYEEWWGCKAEDIIGKKAHEFHTDAQGVQALTAAEQRVLETGKTHESEVSITREGDPEPHERLLIKFPVKSPDGSILGLGTFAVDVTERKRAEELKLALEREKELNEMQRQFVAMVSHEFRTPLTIIDSTAQRMRSQIEKDRHTPEDAIRRIEKIRNSVKRMTRLMESTLTAARLQNGKIPVALEPCDITRVLLDVCTRQQEIATSHIINCAAEALPERIQADPGSLEQVLTNLLSNAVKYSPEATRIDVSARTQGDHVVVSVRDYGVGIDRDELSAIGERFFRARSSQGIAGTGIGLNLAKTLVELHGGSLRVESVRGEGSTFSFRLPISGAGRPVLPSDAARVAQVVSTFT